MMGALHLKGQLDAILVGEPTGGKPNAYGAVCSFQLPHSRLEVRYSTQYFHIARGNDSSLKPDIGAALSLTDCLRGRDRALEAALNAPLK